MDLFQFVAVYLNGLEDESERKPSQHSVLFPFHQSKKPSNYR